MRRLLLLFLLLPLSFSTITQTTITGSIDSAGTSHLKLLTNFTNATGKEIYLNLTGPIDRVVVKDKSGLVLPIQVVNGTGYTLIYATVPVDFLEYDITTQSFTTKNSTTWNFEMLLSSSENISSLQASIDLPQGATLISTNGAVKQSSESLTVLWTGSTIDTNHRAELNASYDLNDQTLGIDPNTVALIAFGAVIIILLIYLIFRKPKPNQEPERAQVALQEVSKPPEKSDSPLESNSVFKTLDETDKEIIREIHAQNNKTTQAHIYTHTHVPKATLSRRLASLENKGIIKKSQKGNRNLVTLTDIMLK